MTSQRYVVLHGHFYQPPRENPWIEEIEVQDSAAPYHDWNERIAAECYRPNSASRVVASSGGIIDIVNNYEAISFNVGPTLMSWLERRAPESYRRILEADARGGGAIAQAYNHAILPLATARDKRTQVRWGMRDFARRFGRPSAGFWMPECAVDVSTLEVLAEEGVAFTILAPGSCARWRAPGGEWITAGVDPRRPYKVSLPSGRSIVVFFYDGVVAQKVAFGDALRDRDALVSQLEAAFDPDPSRMGPQLVHMATDGETFGHHRAFGDMVLAAAIERIRREQPFELLTYAAYLERFPPDHEAEIVSPSSWSCAHGVERWRSDCGCTTPTQPGWHQRWRAPLRDALDDLGERLAVFYERRVAELLRDPWAARDAYIEVIADRSRQRVAAFLDAQAARPLDDGQRRQALKLLELERQALLMQTSCGWFFDELSRPEPVQVLRYAMRAIQLANETGAEEDLEPIFLRGLATAPSNVFADGAEVWARMVKPAVTTLSGVIAHYAISSLFEEYPREGRLYAYWFETADHVQRRRGQTQLAIGRVRMESEITRETIEASFGLIHFGGHDFHCAVSSVQDPGEIASARAELLEAFEEGSLMEVARLLDKRFPGRQYGLGDLFLDGRRKILHILLEESQEHYHERFERTYDENRALLRFLAAQEAPAPPALRVAAELTLSRRIATRARALRWDEPAWRELRHGLADLRQEAELQGLTLDLGETKTVLEERLEGVVGAFAAGDIGVREAAAAVMAYLDVARELGLGLVVWPAQNRLWSVIVAGGLGSADAPEQREAALRLCERFGFDPGVLARGAGLQADPAAAAG
jgi:alpha-amylase/alpha-mannosidase (GH57 family)